MSDFISRQDAIIAIAKLLAYHGSDGAWIDQKEALDVLKGLPSAQPEIIRCKDCEYWRRQTNYQGTPLSFGFCECDDMWRSYGETYDVSHNDTDDDFYCGYAKRRTE